MHRSRPCSLTTEHRPPASTFSPTQQRQHVQRNDPSRLIRGRETAPTPPHHILSPDHRRGSPMSGTWLGAVLRETEKTTRFLSSSIKFLGFSTGPCFPLCGMSGVPSWCFFTPMARVFSRTSRPCSLASEHRPPASTFSPTQQRQHVQRYEPSRPIRGRKTAPTPPHLILSPDHRRGTPMSGT